MQPLAAPTVLPVGSRTGVHSAEPTQDPLNSKNTTHQLQKTQGLVLANLCTPAQAPASLLSEEDIAGGISLHLGMEEF